MRFKKYNLIFLYVVAILFFVLYFLLAKNNRLPYEDYTCVSLVKEMGPLNTMLDFYDGYSSRWSAYLLGFYFLPFYDREYFLFLFNIGTLATLLVAIYLLLKRILVELFTFDIKNKTLASYSILFTVCFFFSSFDIGQVWFWYIVNWVYMWSIIAGLFLVWTLLSKKPSIYTLSLIFILTAYIAGASESYALIYMLVLIALLILKKQHRLKSLTIYIHSNSLIVAFSLLILFYMVTIFAPGTWVRKEALTDASFMEHIYRLIKGYGRLILIEIPKQIPYLLIFSIPWMVLGQTVSRQEKEKVSRLIPFFVKSICLMSILLFIVILPASWILYELAPARALSQVSFLISSYSSFIFFYTGYKIQMPEKRLHAISASALVVGILILFLHILNQYYTATSFSNNYDDRIMRMMQENKAGTKKTILVEPLPPSGMIYSDELSTDTLANNYFENSFGLQFHVALKNN